MKQILFFFLLLLLASCSPDEAPNLVEGEWIVLDKCDNTRFVFNIDGVLCETTEEYSMCEMSWSENGANRYMIYQDDMLISAWYVDFIDQVVARVTVVSAIPGLPASTFYMERI